MTKNPLKKNQIAHNDCRYCSIVSQMNKEEPIGTAGRVDEWLLIEVQRPWKKSLWEEKTEFQPLLQVVEKLASHPLRYLQTRLLALVPDREYTHPELIRVFYYYRPSSIFAEYSKLEYLIPLTEIAALAEALLFNRKQLVNFNLYQQSSDRIREILVCTHTQYDMACGRFGYPLYKHLRDNYANENLRIWQTNHFGGHQFAPTAIDFPTGQVWGHLQEDVLDCLIYRRGDVSKLYRFYRGWTGLGKFAQIAEREIWMQVGWEWLNYGKSGTILKQDGGSWIKSFFTAILRLLPFPRVKLLLKQWSDSATWSQVKIKYQNPNSPKNSQGCYTITVKLKGTVISKLYSGEDAPLISVNQYGVEKLVLEQVKVASRVRE